MIQKFTEESFVADIAKGTTLVDFYADWCGPCKMMTPVLDQVAKDMAGTAVVAKLDIDQAEAIARQFRVTSVPTFILFRDGQEVGRRVGVCDAAAMKNFISTGQ